MKFTELEQQYLAQVCIDETGYIDDYLLQMDKKVARGVISSLIQKGVMQGEDDVRAGQTETWFYPTERGRKFFKLDMQEIIY